MTAEYVGNEKMGKWENEKMREWENEKMRKWEMERELVAHANKGTRGCELYDIFII